MSQANMKDRLHHIETVGKNVLQASKVVFDRSLDACAEATYFVVENTDRIAGVAIVLGAFLGGVTSATMVVANLLNIPPPIEIQNIFGNAPQVIRVLTSAAMTATSGVLAVVGINISKRNPQGPYNLS